LPDYVTTSSRAVATAASCRSAAQTFGACVGHEERVEREARPDAAGDAVRRVRVIASETRTTSNATVHRDAGEAAGRPTTD
jgi:hypothetical protein